jgi:dUTPase
MIKFYMEPGYDVKKPEREYGNSGIDFFIPSINKTFETAFNLKNNVENAYLKYNSKNDSWSIRIPAHGRANIPSGVRSRIPVNIALEAQNKSGIATKLGLVYGAATIDSNYQGLIHISVINTTAQEVDLPLGMKIVQFIPRVIDPNDIEVHDGMSMTLEEFYADFEFNNRGEGAFGSTGV